MQIILGSQSPRRRELLSGIIGEEQIRILPPDCDAEPGFDGISDVAGIESQLNHVVDLKLQNVLRQVRTESTASDSCIICADTIVVAEDGSGHSIVLGKPPADDWQSVVRHWFRTYYSEKTHEVWTGCQVATESDSVEFIVKTRVTMVRLDDWLINWYLATGESVGKAGGYGIQGQASMLVNSINGSLSNVIGLPVIELMQRLTDLKVWPADDQ